MALAAKIERREQLFCEKCLFPATRSGVRTLIRGRSMRSFQQKRNTATLERACPVDHDEFESH
jgi:hypothetical protein